MIIDLYRLHREEAQRRPKPCDRLKEQQTPEARERWLYLLLLLLQILILHYFLPWMEEAQNLRSAPVSCGFRISRCCRFFLQKTCVANGHGGMDSKRFRFRAIYFRADRFPLKYPDRRPLFGIKTDFGPFICLGKISKKYFPTQNIIQYSIILDTEHCEK